MSIIGSNIGASVAGASQLTPTAAGAAKAPSPVAKRAVVRAEDQFSKESAEVEGADAVRAAGGNAEEEAREDRQEHPAYTPQGRKRSGGDPPKLDING